MQPVKPEAAELPLAAREGALGEPAFTATMRALVEAYFAFLRRSERHVRALGLTQSQFDVIATLGNTPGMTCKELARRTLVTKGTLTGVLDRLARRRLISRRAVEGDRRSIHVRLTPQGETVFRRVFPAHLGYLQFYFERALPARESARLCGALQKFTRGFTAD
jgi:DNA-binding MarR family transcriptional regulator